MNKSAVSGRRILVTAVTSVSVVGVAMGATLADGGLGGQFVVGPRTLWCGVGLLVGFVVGWVRSANSRR